MQLLGFEDGAVIEAFASLNYFLSVLKDEVAIGIHCENTLRDYERSLKVGRVCTLRNSVTSSFRQRIGKSLMKLRTLSAAWRRCSITSSSLRSAKINVSRSETVKC